MSKMDHAIRYLIAVEKKYKEYFKEHKLKITDCVDIAHVDNVVNINITNQALPAYIKNDINAMFWL